MKKKSPTIETYKQARDIIHRADQFHQQLTDFYQRLSEKTDNQQVRILLELMSRHEKTVEKALAEYDEKNVDKWLKTWIQYAPDSSKLSIPDVDELPAPMTVEDVVKIAIDLNNRLIKYYAEAQQLVDIPELEDVFGHLKDQEEMNNNEIRQNADAIKHQQ